MSDEFLKAAEIEANTPITVGVTEMSADELRAAAERIWRNFDADENSPFVDPESPVANEIRNDALQLADAYLAGPRWHDKPPVPGTYLLLFEGQTEPSTIWNLKAEYMHLGFNRAVRYFGPIPADGPTAPPAPSA